MAARAGKNVRLKASGAAVSFTDEATTNAGDDKNYQITAATKRVWDPTVTIVVEEDGSATGETYTINRLTGTITFANVDAGRGVVTVTGSYLPLSTVAQAHGFTGTFTRGFKEVPVYGDSYLSRLATLLDWSGKVDQWHSTDTYFEDSIADDTVFVLELSTDAGVSVDLRAWAKCSAQQIAAMLDGVVEGAIDVIGVVDADRRAFHFLT